MSLRPFFITLVLLAAVALGAATWHAATRPPVAEAPGLGPVDAAGAVAGIYRVVPAMLLSLYDALARPDPSAALAPLAAEAAHPALLDLSGKIAAGADFHDLRLLALDARADGSDVALSVTWQEVAQTGAEGTPEHVHIAGPSFVARMRLAPLDGAWKIAAFDLVTVTPGGGPDLPPDLRPRP